VLGTGLLRLQYSFSDDFWLLAAFFRLLSQKTYLMSLDAPSLAMETLEKLHSTTKF